MSRFPNSSCDLSTGLHSVESSCALKTPLPCPMALGAGVRAGAPCTVGQRSSRELHLGGACVGKSQKHCIQVSMPHVRLVGILPSFTQIYSLSPKVVCIAINSYFFSPHLNPPWDVALPHLASRLRSEVETTLGPEQEGKGTPGTEYCDTPQLLPQRAGRVPC